MAKKDKKQKSQDEELDLVDEELDEDDEDDEEGGKGGCLKKLIIFIIIIAIPIALISFNVGGVRDKYLRPMLEKIPIVKNLLPPVETEEGQTEQPIDENQQAINSLTAEIEELNKEIARLKEFENAQLKFKAEKEQFDKMIALNDPKAYATFYETIAPENAEKLYKEAVNKQVVDKKFKDYVQTFENMKKDAATKILEELITTDMDLVITILQNLSSEKRSEILSTMDPKNAASCSKLLYPAQ
nr:hypothetical protein [uncultured Tyzzerella sp.]